MKAFLEVARAVYEGRSSFGDDRGTASDHYKRFAKAGHPGYSLEEAEKPRESDLDDEFEHYMIWYGDIRNRQHRGQKYEPISLEAIRTYEHFLSKLGIEMSAFDWEMMFRLDQEWMRAVPKTPEEIKAEHSRPKPTRH